MHEANIIIHVISGTFALLLGLIALISIKGGKIHNTSGIYFLYFMAIVILTALVGVFVFGRNVFLLVITVLSGYVAFSGFRILKTKSNVPRRLDIVIAVISLIVLLYYLYYFKTIGMIWSPVVIYSTVGALIFVIFYDFLRYLIPRKKYNKHRIWIYEHIYKMTSAFAAILSAFTGTVLDEYQPHSQYLPSALGMMVILGFMLYTNKYGLKKLPKKRI